MQLSKYFVKTQPFGFNFAFAKFLLFSWFFLSPKSCTLTGVLFGGPELRDSVAQDFITLSLRVTRLSYHTLLNDVNNYF